MKKMLSEEEARKILRKAIKLGYRKEMGILEDAYKLGYEVGFYGHMEGTGWVEERMREVLKKAKRYRLEKLIRYLYEKGKDEGVRQSVKRHTLMDLGERVEEQPTERKSEEGTLPLQHRIPGMTKTFRPIYRIFADTKPHMNPFFRMLRK